MAFKSMLSAISACLVIISFNSNAALVGRLAATEGGTDYQAYYDTEANLTWLADATYALTSGYTADGRLGWSQAHTWAAGLIIDGVGGWRLPTSDACLGYDCSGSEMGNLYYNILGNTAGNLTNIGPFSNTQYLYYWTSAPESTINNDSAFTFHMGMGYQVLNTFNYTGGAWAVQTGDISAVPVPAAVWLFGSGLIGLVGFAKRKNK